MINMDLKTTSYKKFYAQFYRYPISKEDLINEF